MATPSQFDNDTFHLGREHLNNFLTNTSKKLPIKSGKLLEIGCQDKPGVRNNFNSFSIDTFDIVDTFNPTIVGDITKFNESISESSYDLIACLEVLEHTLDPFSAIKELRRILKDGGYLMVSAPLNWRIHGPVPDCWRFTEHGWKVLLRDFDIEDISILETPDRELFPIHYCFLAKCNKSKKTLDSELEFRYI